MPTSARLRVSFGVPICLYGSLFDPICILSFLYYNLDLIDYDGWKNSMLMFQKKKKSAKYMFFLMTVLSFAISVYSVLAYQDAQVQEGII